MLDTIYDVPKIEIPESQRTTCMEMLEMFQIDGQPANELVTEGELWIFWTIVFRPSMRVQIVCSTQYGKSIMVAFACIILTCIQNEIVAVVAPTTEKAKIIMRYYIDHLGDNRFFYEQLEADTRLERLRKEESKERIKLRDGGGIFVVSAQSRNANKTLEAAMGLGCKNVIGDEYCLISDDSEATIFRMLAGQGEDAFYCKVGNPFYNEPPFTHFWNSWHDPKYFKVFIDYNQGLEEGRYTSDFIDEAKSKPLFRILFESKFPEQDMMDKKGWMSLLTRKEVEMAMDGAEDLQIFGEKSFGADPADSGVDEAVVVIRGANMAKIEYSSSGVDVMEFVGASILIIKDHDIKSNRRFGDSVGVGAGYIKRLREQGHSIDGINVGEKAVDQRNFVNKKAENYWKMREDIKRGLKLFPDERWYQLCSIKYRAKESDGRMEIMSKQDMRNVGLSSPDVVEALMVTYSKAVRVFAPSYEEKHFKMKMAGKKSNLKETRRKFGKI